MIKVVAIRQGYFNEGRVRRGEAFELAKPEEYSKVWMELAGTKEEIAKAQPLVDKILQEREESRAKKKAAKIAGLPAEAQTIINRVLAENEELRMRMARMEDEAKKAKGKKSDPEKGKDDEPDPKKDEGDKGEDEPKKSESKPESKKPAKK